DDLGIAEDGANCISKLSFWWVRGLMNKGAKGHLQNAEDLFLLPKSLRTVHLRQKFLKEFYCSKSPAPEAQSKRRTTSSETSGFSDSGEIDVGFSGNDEVFEQGTIVKRTLLGGLHYAFGLQYFSLGILKLFCDCLGFSGPLLLHALVSFMENKTEPVIHGYYYAMGVLVSALLTALTNCHFTYWVHKISYKIRAAIITTVYHKTLAVSTTSLGKFSSGEVLNFMSTDTDRVVNFANSFHQFWSLPFQIAVSLYLLYQQVGLAFLAGLGFALLLIPLNRWLAIKIQKYSTEMMTQKDSRVKIMNEILYGIRVIKFYAWENNFKNKVNTFRNAELKSLKGRKYLDAWCVYFWATTPIIISILTFTTYVLMGNQLTAAKVFTSVALFQMLITPLNAFPWVINGMMEAWVSVKRLQAFLTLEELDPDNYYIYIPAQSAGDAVQIVDGHFSWRYKPPQQEAKETKDVENLAEIETEVKSTVGLLSGLNLSIRKGQLIGVIGGVGSGKSSLLSALTAEMDKLTGQVFVAGLDGGFGLVAQEPWIQHATVKENILFGKPYDVDKYSDVINACALREDLQSLPAGDDTEIGENGVNLSGGQKARVGLARAVYQNKSIYLLDDPLAAVDAHVAAHLYKHCITGLLRHKTVILCTHHTKFLSGADHVIVMSNGTVMHSGPPSEILSSERILRQISRDVSRERSLDGKEGGEDGEENADEPTGDGRLVEEEAKDVGAVRLHVYGSYWRAIGHCLATSILLSLLLMQGSRTIGDWWLAYWISHSKIDHTDNATTITHHSHDSTHPEAPYAAPFLRGVNIKKNTLKFYLVVYAGIAVANTVFTLFRAFLFAYGGIKAAKTIHQRLLSSILAAPISFFDITPIGRIINRFSSDVYSIDDSLPFMLNIFLAQAYFVVASLVITCYGLPWMALLVAPLMIIYYYLQGYYRKTSRELKRIITVTESPIYAHFSETLTGLSTIRALRHTQRFRTENEERLEVNQRANYCEMVAYVWLVLRLQGIGVAINAGVAFLAVLEHHFHTVDPGLVGLAMSYALSVTQSIADMVNSFAETEKQMVSVERAEQYITRIPVEKPGGSKVCHAHILLLSSLSDISRLLSSSWPTHGRIRFHNIVLVYRPGLPPALRNVSLEIHAGEKVGIVGRTGSGKSSLFLVLFRMVEVAEGAVILDGVNIASLPLDKLRSRLAIIPQDPFLFSGSVRDNIDPWGKCSDRDLWITLERCHLQQPVSDLGGLDAEVGERGRNFSAGQRQLVCLARAMLTRAKILCIDEATASVDMETDRFIQRTIREAFRTSTVLTIAHRIDTVMDSDRVLVMNKGTVTEFEKPDTLMANQNSLFYSLVHSS
ncbi:predicted protein, partial [Nematostella vectensis]